MPRARQSVALIRRNWGAGVVRGLVLGFVTRHDRLLLLRKDVADSNAAHAIADDAIALVSGHLADGTIVPWQRPARSSAEPGLAGTSR
jgi:hypothetical protein